MDSIQCCECGKRSGYYSTENCIDKIGWRMDASHRILCPSCAHKFIPEEKKIDSNKLSTCKTCRYFEQLDNEDNPLQGFCRGWAPNEGCWQNMDSDEPECINYKSI